MVIYAFSVSVLVSVLGGSRFTTLLATSFMECEPARIVSILTVSLTFLVVIVYFVRVLGVAHISCEAKYLLPIFCCAAAYAWPTCVAVGGETWVHCSSWLLEIAFDSICCLDVCVTATCLAKSVRQSITFVPNNEY